MCSFSFQVKLVAYIVLYSCRLTAFHQGQLRTVAVSELPGYLGRQHAQRSCYVTAKFPRKEISKHNWPKCPGLEPPMVMKLSPDLCVRLPLIFYHNKFDLVVRPYHPYLRPPTAGMAHCPLPDWEREAGGPELFVVNDYNTVNPVCNPGSAAWCDICNEAVVV